MAVHNFNGMIELKENTIVHNMVYAPAAIFTNYQKFNQTAVNYVISNFERIHQEKYEQLEFKMFKEEPLHHEISLFNYYDPKSYDQKLEEDYET